MSKKVILSLLFLIIAISVGFVSVKAQDPPPQKEYDVCFYQETGKDPTVNYPTCPGDMVCLKQKERYGTSITKEFGTCRKKGTTAKINGQICYKADIKTPTTPTVFESCVVNQICDIADETHDEDFPPTKSNTFKIGRCVPTNGCGKVDESCPSDAQDQSTCCNGQLSCLPKGLGTSCKRLVCLAEGAQCTSGGVEQCCSPETACVNRVCKVITGTPPPYTPPTPTLTPTPSTAPYTDSDVCYYKEAGIERVPKKECSDTSMDCVIQTQRYGPNKTKEFGRCRITGTLKQNGEICYQQLFSGILTGFDIPGPVTVFEACDNNLICDIGAEQRIDGNRNIKYYHTGRCSSLSNSCGLVNDSCKFNILNLQSTCCDGLKCSAVFGQCVRPPCIAEGGTCGKISQILIESCCSPELACSNNKCVKNTGGVGGSLGSGGSITGINCGDARDPHTEKCCSVIGDIGDSLKGVEKGVQSETDRFCTDTPGILCNITGAVTWVIGFAVNDTSGGKDLLEFLNLIPKVQECSYGIPDHNAKPCVCRDTAKPNLLCNLYLDKTAEYNDCNNCMSNKYGMWTAIGCIRKDLPDFIAENVFGWGLGLAGFIAFGCIIYSAFVIQTSGGNPEKLKKAQENLTSCIVGLLIIIFSIFILKVIGSDILRIPGFGGSSSGGGGSSVPPYACTNPDLSITTCDAFCKKKTTTVGQYPKGGECSFKLVTPDGDGQDCPNTKEYQEIGSDDSNDKCNYRRICMSGTTLGQCCCKL